VFLGVWQGKLQLKAALIVRGASGKGVGALYLTNGVKSIDPPKDPSDLSIFLKATIDRVNNVQLTYTTKFSKNL